LKSWLNKRAQRNDFFETHYENTKSGTDPGQREEDLRKARVSQPEKKKAGTLYVQTEWTN
jgi:hypothetical protein